MSDTNNSSMRPPKYDEKGGQSFILWMMQFNTWLASKGALAVLAAGFNATLPNTGTYRSGQDIAIAD